MEDDGGESAGSSCIEREGVGGAGVGGRVAGRVLEGRLLGQVKLVNDQRQACQVILATKWINLVFSSALRKTGYIEREAILPAASVCLSTYLYVCLCVYQLDYLSPSECVHLFLYFFLYTTIIHFFAYGDLQVKFLKHRKQKISQILDMENFSSFFGLTASSTGSAYTQKQVFQVRDEHAV